MLQTNNALQEEYLKQLEKDIQEGTVRIEDSSPYFEILEKQFPISGSGIEWSGVYNHFYVDMSKFQKDSVTYDNTLHQALQEIKAKLQSHSSEEVIVIGDGVLDIALRIPFHKVEELCTLTFALPQHSYILPINADWCINYTFEDELFFGKSPVVEK